MYFRVFTKGVTEQIFGKGKTTFPDPVYKAVYPQSYEINT